MISNEELEVMGEAVDEEWKTPFGEDEDNE